MTDTYKINKVILKKARDLGHCPCNLVKPCPCDDFLDNDECICGAYKKKVEK